MECRSCRGCSMLPAFGPVDGAPGIRRDGRMKYRIAPLLAAALICGSASAGEAIAAPKRDTAASRGAVAGDLSIVTDLSSQRRPRRSSTRITVYPRQSGIPIVGRSGPRIDVYPRPYPYEWPGPGATRECVGWLAPEVRPSGTVIVPHRRCVWR